jgi:glycosyltransferase involved in cell wall biosynthesis
MTCFSENEISVNANGGTEIAKRTLGALIDPELQKHFQVVSSRVRELDETKIRIFWAHDLPEDPESEKFKDQKFKDAFHQFVFISNWQYDRYQLVHGFPYDERSIVLETGVDFSVEEKIVAVPYVKEKCDEQLTRVVYTSTPQRGLHLLVPAFESIAAKHPNAHLDVFSSFKIYGWEDRDKQFEPLYDQIRKHPQMTYHGFVPNRTLRDHLKKSHVFAYPSIWLETSCRALIEAAAMGLVCIHPNFGALADTSAGYTEMYQGDFANQGRHAKIMADQLDRVLCDFDRGNQSYYFDVEDERDRYMRLARQSTYVKDRFDIDKIKVKWENMLRGLLERYPTLESRRLKRDDVLVYRTS